MVDINDFTREVICEYKGEVYSVRDNGAVMRHKREGKKARKLDDVWTFGTKNASNGYMLINSHRIHIIVATAFIPGNEDGKMVVDHRDTNRCNNRVENLRWLTRLENVLLNEATLKRVTYLCGGDINKFINDPSCLRDLSGDNQDIMWMRTVTAEEAKRAWEHISAWAKRPTSTYKMMQNKERPTQDFNEWLQRHNVIENTPLTLEQEGKLKSDKRQDEKNIRKNYSQNFYSDGNSEVWKNILESENSQIYEITESLTEKAYQIGFYKKLYFPICQKVDIEGGLDSYALKLNIGDVIARGESGEEYTIESLGWTLDWDAIQVEFRLNNNKTYQYIHIKIEDGKFVHSLGKNEKNYRFCDSPNVLQCGAKTLFSFPVCPKEGNITLEEYAELLHKGDLFNSCEYGNGYIYDHVITQAEDGSSILYVGEKIDNPIKNYGVIIVFTENGKIIHQIERTYFDEKHLQRAFCKIRGQKWDDEDVFDDYC